MNHNRRKKSKYYKKSLLAFLDLSGFKKKVDKSLRSAEEADAIFELLRHLHHTTQVINKGKAAPFVEMKKLKATAFSDSIVLSLAGRYDELFNSFIHVVTYFQWEAIDYYSFLRGAVVFEDICHTREIVFGPALVQAYEMESKVAVWPRVIVDPRLVELLSEANKRYVFDNMLSKDDDGLPFIDYLRYIFIYKLLEEADGTDKIPWSLEPDFVFRQHRKAIWQVIVEPRLSKRVISAFHTLSMYHNECIDRICREFENGDSFIKIDEELKKKYVPVLKADKIDLEEFFCK